MKTEINKSTFPDVEVANEILQQILTNGGINRNEIKGILAKFPGHAYKLPVNQTLFIPALKQE